MERETVQNTRAAREVIGGDRFAVLALNLIDRNPDQPRRQFDEEALAKLALSIEESGVIEPILVRPRQGRYELVAGERRWRAAHRAGLGEIPAVICELDDITAFLLAVTENTAREDLNPIEEARAFLRLVDRAGMSKAEIARRVGRTREAVANLVRLLELPDNALELIETGELSEGHGRALLLCKDHGVRRRLATRAARERWSVRELETERAASAWGCPHDHSPANGSTPTSKRQSRRWAICSAMRSGATWRCIPARTAMQSR